MQFKAHGFHNLLCLVNKFTTMYAMSPSGLRLSDNRSGMCMLAGIWAEPAAPAEWRSGWPADRAAPIPAPAADLPAAHLLHAHAGSGTHAAASLMGKNEEDNFCKSVWSKYHHLFGCMGGVDLLFGCMGGVHLLYFRGCAGQGGFWTSGASI